MAAPQNTEEWRNFFDRFKELPLLWQTTNEQYKNKFARNKAWENLLEIYKIIEKEATVEQMKRKLNNIRTCYRRELKKVLRSEKSGAGADDIYVPSLWYFECLDFLRDHESPDPGMSTADESDNESTGFSLEPNVENNKKRPRPQKKEAEKSEFLRKAVTYLDHVKNEQRDEAAIFAEGWACLFRKLSEEQKLYAKKIIDETLLLGQLNKLSLNNSVTPSSSSTGTPYSSSRSSTPFPSYDPMTQPVILSNESIILPNNITQLFQDTQYS